MDPVQWSKTEKVVKAIEKLDLSTTVLTKKMISLTHVLIVLTIVLAVSTFVLVYKS